VETEERRRWCEFGREEGLAEEVLRDVSVVDLVFVQAEIEGIETEEEIEVLRE
jgi:hypothetical protein